MKTDPELGRTVHEALKKKGIETPVKWYDEECTMDPGPIEGQIETYHSGIMESLRLDLKDDSLSDSPRRVAELYTQELFVGLDYRNFPKCTTVEAPGTDGYREMVCRSGIDVKSMCEHHFLPIVGRATVAYLPSKRILGLSKFDRLVNFFARRPQVQERLTEQIAEAMKIIVGTDNVAVIVSAQHFCISHRGVQGSRSDTVTSRLYGKFMEQAALRAEFLALATQAPPSI
ncbi:MAG: GTP cyclohydrolase I FolE [Nitrospira sp.]